MNQKQVKRLLNVARALRESPNPQKFTMERVFACDYIAGEDKDGFCGTPACAIGHYAHRKDLQKLLKIEIMYNSYETVAKVRYSDMRSMTIDDDRILEHFGITAGQAIELFSGGGCGKAKTPKQAARYIEQFVANYQNAGRNTLVPFY